MTASITNTERHRRLLGWYLRIPQMAARMASHRIAPLYEKTVVQLCGHPRPDTAPFLPSDRPPRILIARDGGIGDILTTLPAVRLLRNAFPTARIDIVVRPCWKPVCEACGCFDRVFAAAMRDRAYDLPNAPRCGVYAFARVLQAQRYDAALDVMGIFDLPRWWVLLSNARHCVAVKPVPFLRGTAVENQFFGRINDPVVLPPQVMGSAVESALAVAEYVVRRGAGSQRTQQSADTFAYPVDDRERERFERWRSKKGVSRRYAVIHESSSKAFKDWTAENFARVAEHLVERWNCDVVISGSARDTERAERLRGLTSRRERVFNGAGELAFFDHAALFEKAQLMVTVDTATMHLADAVGCRLIALFLPWPRFRRYLPRSKNAIVLYPENLPEMEPLALFSTRYIETISADRVIEAVDRTLSAQE